MTPLIQLAVIADFVHLINVCNAIDQTIRLKTSGTMKENIYWSRI